jgi:chromosome segregation ATPase
LTTDVDPETANYVRFYHEKFQKDRPDLLHQIKRATKSEQHAKDDVDSLKSDVCQLKDCVQSISTKFERQLAEMSYEYNRRIANLSTEYDKLANLVTQLLQHHLHQNEHAALLHHHHAAAARAAAAPSSASSPSSAAECADRVASLSHALALRLQHQLSQPRTSSSRADDAAAAPSDTANETAKAGDKRPSPSTDIELAVDSNKKLHTPTPQQHR